MKKLIIALVLLAPLATFGSVQVVKEIRSWEHIAQIQTDDTKNVKVYAFENAGNTCYVAYTSGWTNGNNTNISCVNTPVPVVTK
jgi:hypothetical protein